jgi:hypothetical protein
MIKISAQIISPGWGGEDDAVANADINGKKAP